MNIDIKQLEFISPMLREIVLWLEAETGYDFTITSLYRIGDNGVHGTLPLRGLDLRMRNEFVGRGIAVFVNDNWQYDPSRPAKRCAKLHGDGSNLHLHLQVHPTTRKDNG